MGPKKQTQDLHKSSNCSDLPSCLSRIQHCQYRKLVRRACNLTQSWTRGFIEKDQGWIPCLANNLKCFLGRENLVNKKYIWESIKKTTVNIGGNKFNAVVRKPWCMWVDVSWVKEWSLIADSRMCNYYTVDGSLCPDLIHLVTLVFRWQPWGLYLFIISIAVSCVDMLEF